MTKQDDWQDLRDFVSGVGRCSCTHAPCDHDTLGSRVRGLLAAFDAATDRASGRTTLKQVLHVLQEFPDADTSQLWIPADDGLAALQARNPARRDPTAPGQ